MHECINDDAGWLACGPRLPFRDEFPEQFTLAHHTCLQSIKFKLCPIVLQLRPSEQPLVSDATMKQQTVHHQRPLCLFTDSKTFYWVIYLIFIAFSQL